MNTTRGEMLAKKIGFERNNKKKLFLFFCILSYQNHLDVCWAKLHFKKCCVGLDCCCKAWD
jgi:hypothetical protein